MTSCVQTIWIHYSPEQLDLAAGKRQVTTKRMPSMVTEVSAMFVATITSRKRLGKALRRLYVTLADTWDISNFHQCPSNTPPVLPLPCAPPAVQFQRPCPSKHDAVLWYVLWQQTAKLTQTTMILGTSSTALKMSQKSSAFNIYKELTFKEGLCPIRQPPKPMISGRQGPAQPQLC